MPQSALPDTEALPRRLLQTAHRSVRPTGSQITWHCWGQGSAVFLVHDRDSDWTAWGANIAHLATRFQVWVAELPPAECSLVQDANACSTALRADLQSLNPDQPCSLVAHGWSALPAGLLAPTLASLSSLVLLGAGRHGSSRSPAAPSPAQVASALLPPWERLRTPVLMVWGEALGQPSPADAAIALAASRPEREWLLLPCVREPLPQTCADEINVVLSHWLLSHA